MTHDPEFDSLVPAQSFTRRGFLVTSLGAGFALAVQPVMAQTAITTKLLNEAIQMVRRRCSVVKSWV